MYAGLKYVILFLLIFENIHGFFFSYESSPLDIVSISVSIDVFAILHATSVGIQYVCRS